MMLSEAKQQFFQKAARSKGTTCPCCERFGKVYARKFNTGMAVNLIYLYQKARADFVHLPSTAPRYILNDNQVGKLMFWNMAIPQPNDNDPSKNKSGCWKISDTGIAFVENRITVWSHVIEYNQVVRRYREQKRITISDALGKPFHYQELMRDSP